MGEESESVDTKEPLAAGIREEQIGRLIAEKKRNGATECKVVTEDGQRFLICRFPPL
jgi:hypothetical protein